MKKILVPTDFSPNSKSGIRFAIHWAAQQNLELVYIHVINILTPTRWSRETANNYISGELDACKKQFTKFIHTVYQSLKIKPGLFSTIVIQEDDPAKTLLDYCRRDKSIDCICISTNGAGSVMKLFGTNTSKLISKSPIPVLAIPGNYKHRGLKSVLYAADFHNFKDEMEKVLNFAILFKAKVDVVHFSSPGEFIFDEETIKKLSGGYQYGLNVFVEENEASLSLEERLQKEILIRKPSVVIMFSNKQRNFMQKMFFSSKAEQLSFSLKTPLLIYSKGKSPIKTKKNILA